ncbi:cation-transporting P-type ATPase [soil metagenome]
MKHSYQQDVAFLIQHFSTNTQSGLSEKQARELLKKYGPNALPEQPQPSIFWVFLTQFSSPLIYILLLAAVLIFIFGDNHLDAFIIMGILLFNSIIGTIQEGRTHKILAGLKKFLVQDAVVVRDGKKRVVESKYLVPGDIIIVQDGQLIPADMRIIESHELRMNEAMLTGESEAVVKNAHLLAKPAPIADQTNMLFSGTFIVAGWARAIIVATGSDTELGKIHRTVEHSQTEMPLAKQMRKLSWFIIWFVICICLLLLGIGIVTGYPAKELIVLLTALFICVIPEGLPVVVTLVLVSGVYRMAKQKVLVKNMQAVEGLGHANVIVIDKTGTLTRNEMIVTRVHADNKNYTVSGKGYIAQGSLFHDGQQANPEYSLEQMATGLMLLNTATITFVEQRNSFEVKGDPTQAALYVLAKKLEVSDEADLDKEYKKIFEIPFESTHKYHASFYEYKGKGIGFVAGTPEVIFKMVSQSDAVAAVLNSFLHDGLRVIAVAQCDFNLSDTPPDAPKNYFEYLLLRDTKFLGLCGIEDAIRPETAHTISRARKAGFQIVMATGDHQRTAIAIAKQVGIYQEGDEAIDGPELEKLSDAQLQEIITHATVFSRVSPEQKLRIIKAFHARGLLVAMTGDGINDAPSLVAADIGIAMGGIGTEVAKEASDLILLDDSVKNIISAIEEGRHTIYALRRVILYFFSTNLAEILIILFAFIASLSFPQVKLAFPLTAAQILWLNLVTDGFLDSALALEKKEKGLLFDQKWFGKQNYIIDTRLIWHMLCSAVPMARGSLFVCLLASPVDLPLARTMTLLTLGMFQWFNAWNCRSETLSIFQLGWWTNKWLILATILVISLQVLLLYVPFLQSLFSTVPLNGYQWFFAALVSSTILWIEEARKLVMRSKAG